MFRRVLCRSAKGTKRHPTLGVGVIIGAGAKVLGAFTVGDNAKVGSNAVVMKEVPPCATAVGNPARIILKEEHVQAGDDPATRVFSSYGITPDLDDPLIKALQGLINHAAAQDQQIRILNAALEKAGITHENLPDSAKFDLEKFRKLIN